MKERIYSIPLTEALEENSGCPLCTLEKKLQEQAVEYFLGPSMMEPDSREMTNEKGFCKNHKKCHCGAKEQKPLGNADFNALLNFINLFGAHCLSNEVGICLA